jgi:hypothetical protein
VRSVLAHACVWLADQHFITTLFMRCRHLLPEGSAKCNTYPSIPLCCYTRTSPRAILPVELVSPCAVLTPMSRPLAPTHHSCSHRCRGPQPTTTVLPLHAGCTIPTSH